MSIQESGEMYLETIRILSIGGKNVRAIDVGEYMGYSKPSVSRAMKILRDKRLIEIDALGHITLTEQGAEIANTMYERHKLLTEFLAGLGVSEQTADADACKIEHCISEESFEAIKKHLKKGK
jgi:Mn-dependent DtxR family transcriptional regulator